MQTRQPDSIRQTAVASLLAHGATEPVVESLLFRDLRLVGRKFVSGQFRAIWIFDAETLAVYDANGQVEDVPVSLHKEEQRKAA